MHRAVELTAILGGGDRWGGFVASAYVLHMLRMYIRRPATTTTPAGTQPGLGLGMGPAYA